MPLLNPLFITNALLVGPPAPTRPSPRTLTIWGGGGGFPRGPPVQRRGERRARDGVDAVLDPLIPSGLPPPTSFARFSPYVVDDPEGGADEYQDDSEERRRWERDEEQGHSDEDEDAGARPRDPVEDAVWHGIIAASESRDTTCGRVPLG